MGLHMADRIKSKRYPGVYYRESSTVKHNGKPDKIFCFSYSIAHKTSWVKVGRASEGITEEYTNQRRIEFLNKLRHGENPAAMARRKLVTVEQIVDAYFLWREGEGSRIVEDRSRYALHIKPVLASIPVQNITPERLDALKAKLADTLSPASVKKIFTFLRAAVNLAIRRKKYQGINPFSSQGNFSMPIEDNKCERALTKEEAQRLLTELERRSTDLYHMALVSLKTGLRSTEIFGLTGSDVHAAEALAYVTAKGGAREPVALPQDVLSILEARRTAPDALLFPDRKGNRRKTISDSFARAVDALHLNEGITDKRQRIWFHSLRHTFASWLAQSGKVTLHELMHLLRHKRIEMTLRYAHLIPNQQRDKLSIIADVLGENQ